MLALPDTPQILGRTEPRLWTPPLRELTPATSYGFAVIDFARDVLGTPLDPWQEWAVIHGGEMLDDGRPRFRTLLVLVARQAGKTHLLTCLALYWMFVEKWPLTLGMSTMLEYARESWDAARQIAEESFADQLPRNAVKEGNNDVRLLTTHGSRYKIAAANRRGGRSLRIDRLIIDELREHQTWQAWNAATNAMNARPRGQAWCITNQGDVTSVVLASLRKSALEFIETAEGDPRVGLLEWSAPDGCEVDDPEAIAQANPNAGRRRPGAEGVAQHWDDLLGPARRAKRNGGDEEAGFRTEVLCQAVPKLNPALDLKAYAECLAPGGLDRVRNRVAMVWDVSPDLMSVVLYAAAKLPDERVQIDAVKAWEGPACTRLAMRELPALIGRTKPAAVGWLPNGPSAALAADMVPRPGVWPPIGVNLVEIKADLPAVCMGFDELIRTRQLVRSGRQEAGALVGDPLLDSQVETVEWLNVGNGRKVFSRRGGGHANAVYGAAGAAHLARTLPPPRSMTMPSPGSPS